MSNTWFKREEKMKVTFRMGENETDDMSKSKLDPFGVCSLRGKANSVNSKVFKKFYMQKM